MVSSERRYSTVPEEENAETITELINTFLENLNAQQDRQSIKLIQQDVGKLQKIQAEKLDRENQKFSEISKQVDQCIEKKIELEKELDRLLDPKEMNDFQLQQQHLRDQIQQGNSDYAELEREIETLQNEIKELEDREKVNEPVSVELYSKLISLALSIYQSLGVEFFEMDPITRQYQKGIAKSEMSNRIVPFEIHEKYSNQYYANMLWDIISQ